MSDRLQELSVLVRAAKTGSFSRVARELGISQPSVSRTVERLEGVGWDQAAAAHDPARHADRCRHGLH
jgi:Mn-dependent DtxR family transcriptional regulator